MNPSQNNRLSHVRSAIYRQPWMITEAGLELICSIAERHCDMDSPEAIEAIKSAENSAFTEFLERDKTFNARLVQNYWGELVDKKFYDIQEGVGVLRLLGPIFPRANLVTRMSGATALETWTQDFDECLADPEVNAMIILVDSPGGSVSGGLEMATKIFNARTSQPKPIVASIEGVCASLAYLICSQCDAVYISEASMVGSIGVVMAIEDDSRKKENEGVKRTVLKTGKNKAIGVGPVTDDQIESLRGMMEDYFDRFKSAVSRAREGIDIESVSDGSLWIGQKAVSMGLVDGVSTMENVLAELSSGVVV